MATKPVKKISRMQALNNLKAGARTLGRHDFALAEQAMDEIRDALNTPRRLKDEREDKFWDAEIDLSSAIHTLEKIRSNVRIVLGVKP